MALPSNSTAQRLNSLLSSLEGLSGKEQRRVLEKLGPREAAAILYCWRAWARTEQLPPAGDWTIWLYLAGRGAGKTRAGAEFVRERVESGEGKRIALVAATAADARKVMIEGESGILAVSPPWCRPTYIPTQRSLIWPNGAIATTYSAEEPDMLRGPQHDTAWADEICKWGYPDDTWANLQFGLRLGERPQEVVTTTPRNMKLLREILARTDTVVSRGTTYDNRVNLAPAFFREVIRRYEGSRLGRQELKAELLEDVPGALWERRRIDELRVPNPPELVRIVVAVDPPASSGEDADECGIVVAGKDGNEHAYVLADLSKRQLTPSQWAERAIDAYHRYEADAVVAEANQGGEMVRTCLRHVDPSVPIKLVHATRGKALRAEPVATLYEQGRVHHASTFAELEDQMCAMTLDFDRNTQGSPDRLDALVWAITELLPGKRRREIKVT